MLIAVEFKPVFPAFDLFGHLARRERLKCPRLMAIHEAAEEPEIEALSPAEIFMESGVAFFVALDERDAAANIVNARRSRRRRRSRCRHRPTSTVHFSFAMM